MTPYEFEKLVNKYTDCIYRIAVNACCTREDAEDLTQEAFTKLWRCRHVFETDEDAKRWLIRVTVNAGKNLLRHFAKKEILPIEDLFQEPSFEHKDFSYLHQAIGVLPLKYRQVLYLYYFEGYQIREIADILKRSETSVQTQLQRARDKLRQELEEQ